MRYNKQVLLTIDELAKQGLSGRKIAKIMNLSKSGVNNYLREKSSHKEDFPKILFYDLETAPTIAAVFGRYDINITDDNIISQGDWIISASWKWAHEDKVNSAVVKPRDAILGLDIEVVRRLSAEFDKADFVVAHHGDGFDGPVFRTRLLENGLPPHKPVRSIDTKKMAKKFFFRSNKLETLGRRLAGQGKVKHDGIDLWIRCMRGEPSALQEMTNYNKKDVLLLESIYYEMLPYDNTAPALSAYFTDNKLRCPKCGHDHLEPYGSSYKMNLSEYALYQCSSCDGFSRGRTNLLTKEKRNSILLSV